MQEIALHVLDILQNSVTAGSTSVKLIIIDDVKEDVLQISIEDNGCGMESELLKRVCNPFVTGRTTRKVGLGIPLFKASAESCGGSFHIDSTVGVGTKVTASFKRSHIDTPPMGDIPGTLVSVVTSYTTVDFELKYQARDIEFEFDTKAVKQILGDVPINNIEVCTWLIEYIKEGMSPK